MTRPLAPTDSLENPLGGTLRLSGLARVPLAPIFILPGAARRMGDLRKPPLPSPTLVLVCSLLSPGSAGTPPCLRGEATPQRSRKESLP